MIAWLAEFSYGLINRFMKKKNEGLKEKLEQKYNTSDLSLMLYGYTRPWMFASIMLLAFALFALLAGLDYLFAALLVFGVLKEIVTGCMIPVGIMLVYYALAGGSRIYYNRNVVIKKNLFSEKLLQLKQVKKTELITGTLQMDTGKEQMNLKILGYGYEGFWENLEANNAKIIRQIPKKQLAMYEEYKDRSLNVYPRGI